MDKDIDIEKLFEHEDQLVKYKTITSNLVYGKKSGEEQIISVVIPTFRRTDTLKLAIESARNQSYDRFYEIIVVDNDPEDHNDTMDMMEEICANDARVLYYKNAENIGMYPNWNRTIELASSKYVLMLHDDDLLQEECLSRVAHELKRGEFGALGVFSDFLEEEEDGSLVVSKKTRGINDMKDIVIKLAKDDLLRIDLSDAIRSIHMSPTACTYNKQVFMELGGFDEKNYPAADLMVFYNMMLNYNCGIIPQKLAIRRIGRGASQKREVLEGILKEQDIVFSVLREKLNCKKWIKDYTVTVNFGINNFKKYNEEIDVRTVLKENGLTTFWTYIPELMRKMIMAGFWLRLIRKIGMRKQYGK